MMRHIITGSERTALPAFLLLAVICQLCLAGCSLERMAADTAAGMLGKAMQAFAEEPDPALAREAMPANLKLLEGLLKVAPDHPGIQTVLARGWCSYAFAFIDAAGPERERASALYRRGFQYGIGSLPPNVAASLRGESLADMGASLDTVGKDQVEPLFWSAYCLGNWVNLNLASVDGVADLSKAELMMRRVRALDPGYYHGGADVFYGAYYGSRPRMLGGDPAVARKHLEKAIAVSGGRFLPARLFLAEVYAVAAQDEQLFERTLKDIVAAPPDIMPEERLANAIARDRARHLLARKAELFPTTDAAEAQDAVQPEVIHDIR